MCQMTMSSPVLVRFFDLLEVPREKLGERVPPSAEAAGVLLREGNKLAGKHHGVMPLSWCMDFHRHHHTAQVLQYRHFTD